MTHFRVKQFFLLAVFFFITVFYCAAQTAAQRGKIAILSFTGGSLDERDGIAELFSFTQQMMQNFTVIPRTTITNAISREQGFQASGMTDADTIKRLGNQFGANYVMAGSITSLGRSNLLIVSIVKIDVVQQVAGDFIIYNSLDDLVKDKTKIDKMATKLISLMQKDTKNQGRLAVVPVDFSGNVNRAEGDALAQLLSIHLLNYGRYSVYPRTQTLDQVRKEFSTQYSGVTRDSQMAALGVGTNPEYVLSIISRKIGSQNMFNTSVIDVEAGNQIAGLSEQYANINDGIQAMEIIAKQLSGVQLTERERSRRSANVSSATSAEEKAAAAEERAREREAAAEARAAARREFAKNFLKDSILSFDGWFGNQLNKPSNVDSSIFSGGVLIGFSYKWFGLQTGFNIIGWKNAFPIGHDFETISSTIFQLPVLGRINIPILNLVSFSPYAGIGINLTSFSGDSDLEIKSLSTVSVIAGLDIGIMLWNTSLSQYFYPFIGFQYNGDITGNNVFSYNANEQTFKRSIIYFTLGLHFKVPLSK